MIVFDLDGTLRDPTHRVPLISGSSRDWDGFYKACADDAPIWHQINNLKHLVERGENVMIWSGCADIARLTTIDQLNAWGIVIGNDPISRAAEEPGDTIVDSLWMRSHGDYTPDDQLKKEWYEHYSVYGEHDPITMVFDDRDCMVKMWRSVGVTCIQVAEGDF
jgi:FMN phosphatase YigB (HAD superfamily)